MERGAELFQQSADAAQAAGGDARTRLRLFIAGHVDVVLEHIDETRTFLNEARALEAGYRGRIIEARDRYEQVLRSLLAEGAAAGEFRRDLDPKLAGIFILSILNALDRWYRHGGGMERDGVVDEIMAFVSNAL